jgi:hypothetical protein
LKGHKAHLQRIPISSQKFGITVESRCFANAHIQSSDILIHDKVMTTSSGEEQLQRFDIL